MLCIWYCIIYELKWSVLKFYDLTDWNNLDEYSYGLTQTEKIHKDYSLVKQFTMSVATYYPRYNADMLESNFRTSKKTIQEYVREIERHCRYKSVAHQLADETILDDRGKLIDHYEACVQQDAHLAGV